MWKIFKQLIGAWECFDKTEHPCHVVLHMLLLPYHISAWPYGLKQQLMANLIFDKQKARLYCLKMPQLYRQNKSKWETSFFFGWREKGEGGKCKLYKLTIMSLLYNSGKVRGIQNPDTRICCVFCFWTIVNFGYHSYLLFGQVKNC